MRRQHLVRSAGTALAAVLALTLTGCGGDDAETASSEKNVLPSGGSIPGKADAENPAATENDGAEESTKPTSPKKSSSSKGMTFSELTTLLSTSMKKGGTAVVSMTASQAETSTETSGLIDYRTNPPSMSMTTKVAALGGEESTIIMVDNVMYMDMGEMSQGKFLKMPLDDGTAQMLDLSQLDPATAFKKIYGDEGTVTERGEEKLKAGTFRRYDAEVSTKKLRDDLPEAVRGDVPATAKYSFWFDSDDLVRQVEVDLGSAGKTLMTYDQWGSKVTIKAPPASDVTDMPQTPTMPEAPAQ